MIATEVTTLQVNASTVEVTGPGHQRLLDVLRESLGLVGTREGCGAGECGACHVLIQGRSEPACLTPISACAGKTVTTVEGLPQWLRDAFVQEQAAQCGFCSSGMLIGAAALLAGNPQPDEAQIKAALQGHLCRCGAHWRIVRAVQRAAKSMAMTVAAAPASHPHHD